MLVRVTYIVFATEPVVGVIVQFGHARCNADGGKRKV